MKTTKVVSYDEGSDAFKLDDGSVVDAGEFAEAVGEFGEPTEFVGREFTSIYL